MPALSYRINVSSPCDGNQLVTKISPVFYSGSGGDFTYAILTRSQSSGPWTVVVYDYSGGDCSPQAEFQQAQIGDEPAGVYHLVGPNGPDPNLGQATVSAYP
jgi:hypothetical protein